MEEDYFNKVLKEKLSNASGKAAKPNWKQMRFLLEQHGLTKGYTVLKKVLLVSLGIITLLNAGFMIYLLSNKTETLQVFTKNTTPSKVEIYTVDTLYTIDTLLVKKTIYRFDTVYVNKKTVIFNNTSLHNNNLKNINNKLGAMQSNNRFSAKEKKLTASERYTLLLKKAKNSSTHLPVLVPVYSDSTSTVTSRKEKNYTVPEKNKLPETVQDKTVVKQNKKPLKISFSIGAVFSPLWIINNDFSKGQAFHYGLVPSITLNKHVNFFTGILIGNLSYQLNDDAVSKRIEGFPDAGNVNNVNEIYVKSRYYTFPLGFRYLFHIGKHFAFFPELGLQYYFYKWQEFNYEYKDNGHEQLIVLTKNNSYSGFGHFFAGFGVSYIAYDKLNLAIIPTYYLPVGKVGAERIFFPLFSAEIMINWRF